MKLKEKFLEIKNRLTSDKDYNNGAVISLSSFCALIFMPQVMKGCPIICLIKFIAQVSIYFVFYFAFWLIFANIRKLVSKLRLG